MKQDLWIVANSEHIFLIFAFVYPLQMPIYALIVFGVS